MEAEWRQKASESACVGLESGILAGIHAGSKAVSASYVRGGRRLRWIHMCKPTSKQWSILASRLPRLSRELLTSSTSNQLNESLFCRNSTLCSRTRLWIVQSLLIPCSICFCKVIVISINSEIVLEKPYFSTVFFKFDFATRNSILVFFFELWVWYLWKKGVQIVGVEKRLRNRRLKSFFFVMCFHGWEYDRFRARKWQQFTRFSSIDAIPDIPLTISQLLIGREASFSNLLLSLVASFGNLAIEIEK